MVIFFTLEAEELAAVALDCCGAISFTFYAIGAIGTRAALIVCINCRELFAEQFLVAS